MTRIRKAATRAAAAATTVDPRDAAAVSGLAMVGVGVAGALSVWIACIVVGALLIAAAVSPIVVPLVMTWLSSGKR